MRLRVALLLAALAVALRLEAAGAALSPAEALANTVARQPAPQLNQTSSGGGGSGGAANQLVNRATMAVRLTGARFVPLTLADQRLIVKAVQDTLAKVGPVELLNYREALVDAAAPDGIRERAPCVELAFALYFPQNITASREAVPPSPATIVPLFLSWARALLAQGQWPGMGRGDFALLNLYFAEVPVPAAGFALHPVMVLDVELAAAVLGGSDSLPGPPTMLAEHASAVALVVRQAVVGGVGSLVEVANYTQQPTAAGGLHRVTLQVSALYCRDDASVASPECEQQVVEAVVQQVLGSPDAQAQLAAAGVANVSLVEIAPRAPPVASNASVTEEQQRAWAPRHLDRVDQRALPLDGKFTANATGRGVNVFILSSGILGNHTEFGYLDGSPGSRVRSAWGYLGLNPAEDCADASVFYGFGTASASICCGLRLGAAKNAIIHSVRFRETCTSDADNWSPGTLPSAMDLVLSTYRRPAIVLIDTWWSSSRINATTAQEAKETINDRLNKFTEAGITVIAPAGPASDSSYDACANIFAAHPAVISVAASSGMDQAVGSSPRNSSCIDIWAPSGGTGWGQIMAFSVGATNYTRVINGAFGAAPQVVGVAAQYMQLHPNATAPEVKRALLEMASNHTVTSGGPQAPTLLLYTNMTEPAQDQGQQAAGGGGISAGAIAGIAVGAVAGLACVAAVAALIARRKRRLASSPQLLEKSFMKRGFDSEGWEIRAEELEICKRADGSDWLLGEGRYGRVYKAMKGSVQVVAVKAMAQCSERLKGTFMKEVEVLKLVSRDANITQFYGACFTGDQMLIVSEFMEGGDLREALSRDTSGQLLWYRRGKGIMLDICRGVSFLHSAGPAGRVIHRDIKSKNVLLGRECKAKLADVGLALLYDEQEQQEGATPRGFVGTLAWAAPEVLMGEPVTEKADIYSLGVVLWELVTGENPQRGRLRDPEVPRECPQGVLEAIHVCMNRDPQQRPSARKLYAMLLACPPAEDVDGQLLLATTSASASSGHTPPLAANSSAELASGGSSGAGAAQKGPSPAGSAGSNWLLGSAGMTSLLASHGPASMVAIDYAALEFCRNPDGSRQQLGRGSFGDVVKVMLDGVQPLACKVLQLGNDPEVHAAFLHEASVLWHLRHKNVVNLSGVVVHGSEGYLLMELMESSLYKMLNARTASGERVFSWYKRGKNVLLDCGRGLHFLHSLKVMHMDIKSGNVLLARDLTAKISDVGLSRIMTKTHLSLSFDESTGTLPYLAPELLAAEPGAHVTQAVDIFSFGILLQEVCSGMHPQVGKPKELRVPEDCPQEVADLYAACMAVDPAARPSAREVVERLVQAIKLTTPAAGASGRSVHGAESGLPPATPAGGHGFGGPSGSSGSSGEPLGAAAQHAAPPAPTQPRDQGCKVAGSARCDLAASPCLPTSGGAKAHAGALKTAGGHGAPIPPSPFLSMSSGGSPVLRGCAAARGSGDTVGNGGSSSSSSLPALASPTHLQGLGSGGSRAGSGGVLRTTGKLTQLIAASPFATMKSGDGSA